MAAAQLAFQDARGGMNAFDPPHKVGVNQLPRMVNCEIVEGLPTTRMGARVTPLSGDAEPFVQAAFQGSIFYNPAKGQGGIVLGDSNPSLAASFGGRKLRVTIKGRRTRATAEVQDISNGLYGNAQNHLAWMAQREDKLVVADGEGSTFIYDPKNGGSYSRGYFTADPDRLQSQVPNAATCLLYSHARGVAVVSSREMLVGDALFRTSQTGTGDIIAFTEQVFAATGYRFVPPTAMGGINALASLALKNTQHGHGAVIAHCTDGIFSADISQAPRASWYDKQLVKIVTTEAGATGPYAVASVDGDQFYRSPKGVQTLRSAAATSGLEGNPLETLSPEVDTWFQGDYPRWLRFASACAWDACRKIFFTVAPIVQGSHRWHRGMVVRNTDTQLTVENTPAAWEGLWTLPPQMAGIAQLVNGSFDGEQRQFAWTRGTDGVNRLVEFSPTFREDILADGSARPIRAQVITRAIDAGEWWKKRDFSLVRLYLRNIAGKVRWGVWFRPEESPVWTPLRSGSAEVPDFTEDAFDLIAPMERSVAIPLGKLSETCGVGSRGKANQSRSIQFLVRWEGYCSLEGLKVETGTDDLSATDFDKSLTQIKFAKATDVDYSDWEYSETDAPLWIQP